MSEESKKWLAKVIVIVIIVVVVLLDYRNLKSSLPTQYWYWAGLILVISVMAEWYTEKVIAKRFAGLRLAGTITEILFAVFTVVPQLILFAWMYRPPE